MSIGEYYITYINISEFIDKKLVYKHKNLKISKEEENVYTRYEYLIALCYLLNLNDLHLENIIAYGEHPVISDIETAFSFH